MRFAFQPMKLVVKPGGAVALAAVLEGLTSAKDSATLVVIFRGNVDPAAYAAIVQG
jgi:threonine dehydratase